MGSAFALCFLLLFIFIRFLKAVLTAWCLFCWRPLQISAIRVSFMRLRGLRNVTIRNEGIGSLFLTLFHVHPPQRTGIVCLVGLRGDGWSGWSEQPSRVQMNDSISLRFLSSAICKPFYLAQAHTPALFHSETPLSLSSECVLLHAIPLLPFPLYIIQSGGPLLYPLSPAFLSKVSRSVFLLSPAVLHSCFGCEGGGQGRGREEEEGGTWALQRGGRGREGKGEGGPLSLWECLLPGVLRGEPQHD